MAEGPLPATLFSENGDQLASHVWRLGGQGVERPLREEIAALLRLTARFSSCIGGIAAPSFVVGGSLRDPRRYVYERPRSL